MIGSIAKGSDFGGCVRYALAVDEPGKETRLLYSEGVLTDTDTEKIDNFTANPPVQKVEKTIRIARESWQWYLTLGFTVFSTLLFFAMTFWQEGRIERCQVSDIKYHYILMHNGVNSVGLDSIESRFRDPDKVKIIESEVRDYEERVQETARAIEQKHRLEQKINELNTQSQYSKK